jgi:hypothetical protein
VLGPWRGLCSAVTDFALPIAGGASGRLVTSAHPRVGCRDTWSAPRHVRMFHRSSVTDLGLAPLRRYNAPNVTHGVTMRNTSHFTLAHRVIPGILAAALTFSACSGDHLRNGEIGKGSSSSVSPTVTSPSTSSSSSDSTPPAGPPLLACSHSSFTTRQGGVGVVGAAGALYVSVEIRNDGKVACQLDSDVLSATLTTSHGRVLTTKFDSNCGTACLSPVRLSPGETAIEDLDWSNWCSGPPGAIDVTIDIPGTGVIEALATSIPTGRIVPGTSIGTTPACVNDAAESSLMAHFPWNRGPTAA